MILTLDIGNSQLFGGLFSDSGELLFNFRKASQPHYSSDEHGLFLVNVLKNHGYHPSDVTKISVGSVVPDCLHPVRAACIRYLDLEPLILQAGVKTGLKIQYRNPIEVGADRIANAIAGTLLYPDQPLCIVDFGTATTVCLIDEKKHYLGGLIMPGMRLAMHSLEKGTAKLPSVEIKQPETVLGRSTIECIQSGLYFSTLGAVNEILKRVKAEYFNNAPMVVLGTGGFVRLFADEGIFDAIETNLPLLGLYHLASLN